MPGDHQRAVAGGYQHQAAHPVARWSLGHGEPLVPYRWRMASTSHRLTTRIRLIEDLGGSL